MLPKDYQVWPVPARKRTVHPHNITCKDANSNLVAEAGGPELERPKCLLALPALLDLAISTIDRDKAVVPFVVPLAIGPQDLEQRGQKHDVVREDASTKEAVYKRNRLTTSG